MAYTERDMALFETLRKLDADTAELSDISGIGIFVGKRIDGEDGEHRCVSMSQFSDMTGVFKVATAIASDEDIYERFMMVAAIAQEIYENTHPDEDEDEE